MVSAATRALWAKSGTKDQGLFKVGAEAEGAAGDEWRGGEAAAGGGDGGGAEGVDEADGGVTEGGHDLGGVVGAGGGAILVEGHVADVVQPILNGLIANDKICFVRIARLMRDQARRSSPRGRRRPPNPGYPSDDGDRCGGSDETRLAYPTGVAGATGRGPALGPRVSGAAALDGPGVGDPDTGASGKGAS